MVERLCRISYCVLIVFSVICLFNESDSQSMSFVEKSDSGLVVDGKLFYSFGVNCYYLQNLAAHGDTDKVKQVFNEAKRLGVNTIRTWGFFDSSDSTNAAVIQYAPGKFNENALRALDFVIAQAGKDSIRLIIPLVNNWDDYGGMNQYVSWYVGKTGQSLEKISDEKFQEYVSGVGNRKYRKWISNELTHDDFYTNTLIKSWYIDYVFKVLTRRNTYTNVRYRDDPTILFWELANEPRSSDNSGLIVNNWLEEMSAFVKTVDTNHLLGTGEEGFDVSNNLPINVTDYPAWMFDGSSGTSFYQNISLQNIDVASVHLYPEPWNLDYSKSTQWISDHLLLSKKKFKPLVIGEVGVRQNKELFYNVLFHRLSMDSTSGVLLWQVSYDGSPYVDQYSFNWSSDSDFCNSLQHYSVLFQNKDSSILIRGDSSRAENIVLQNYPNPFSNLTLITYRVESPVFVLLEVYNILGQKVRTLEEGIHQSGEYRLILDGNGLPSGAYLVLMRYGGGFSWTKTVLLR
jgi:mannan endo-1,4-beta-mannosidase